MGNNSIRALWFSNIAFREKEMDATGTWITGMAEALLSTPTAQIKIFNITQGSTAKIEHENIKDIEQWILPQCKKTYPSKFLINNVSEIINKIQPDIIHIWGTESYWGSIPFHSICPNIPVILDMQGFVQSVAENYYADLSFKERLKCIHLKEILKPSSSSFAYQHRYKKAAKREAEIIKLHKNISVQSNWIESCIKSINPDCTILHTGISLRKQFYNSNHWKPNNHQIIFSTASTTTPLKGLFLLLKAFNIVHSQAPNTKLVIAGELQSGIRISGFSKFLIKYIKTHKLTGSISFIGALNASQLTEQLQKASVFVNPSYVESYSLVIAEAMMIGTPTVATFAGAMPELGKDNESILYFPKGDYIMCAQKIINLLNNPTLAATISAKAQEIANHRNDISSITQKQLKIYSTILSKQL